MVFASISRGKEVVVVKKSKKRKKTGNSLSVKKEKLMTKAKTLMMNKAHLNLDCLISQQNGTQKKERKKARRSRLET